MGANPRGCEKFLNSTLLKIGIQIMPVGLAASSEAEIGSSRPDRQYRPGIPADNSIYEMRGELIDASGVPSFYESCLM